ncbi:MAG: transketolase [Actinomycetia bacterium]|nr:transketolase [Actinomycetes bacterium]MCP3910406.1 transketolase [Actinomycetes bacterium]MCP4085469.1 transketolase [Actinomycetes bacterium]
MNAPELDQRAVNVVKGLAIDGPHRANSGHQGTAMALAPLAHVLFTRVMNYDASTPDWPDRDRFVLSAGHASILQYAMLHLTGFGLTLDDLKDFRQWGSATPGHPEVGHTAGVEVTTGPLGQGFANAVGMAAAERNLRARFGDDVCDHHVFAIAGDGCLAEGLSHEAASLAGHLGLGRLVVVYDDNKITIDGPTDLSLSDDAAARFRSYGWHVVELGEAAEDLDVLEGGLREAMSVDDRPSLVVLRSHIAYPSPGLTDHHEAHGLAFDDAEIAATRKALGLPAGESFSVPEDVLTHYREAGSRGAPGRESWEKRMAAWTGDRACLDAALNGQGLDGWADALPTWETGDKVATRKASGACIAAALDTVPGLMGGGADLTGNTGTVIKDHGVQSAAEPGGRQMYFGVREHAMASMMNGMALHGGAVPVGGTFLVFADYCRPAIRLAALSNAKVIYSFTHDSVGVGEDGPTHQPVEQVMSLRTIPGLGVIRPADANETAQAWQLAVDGEGPTALILTRQDVPVLGGTGAAGQVAKGGYLLVDATDYAVTLVGTGSEVSVCVTAAQLLAADGVAARVVSLPSWDRFAAQSADYQASVIDRSKPTVGCEAGVTLGWERYADVTVGIDRFGASAPGGTVMVEFGITPENVAATALSQL